MTDDEQSEPRKVIHIERGSGKPADFKSIGEKLVKATSFYKGLADSTRDFNQQFKAPSPLVLEPDTSRYETADNTREMADHAARMADELVALTGIMQQSVELSAATRADAAAAQASAKSSGRHAIITGYGSLLISLVALAIAIFRP